MVARDGYAYVGIDSTTDSRPAPVPSRPPRNSRPIVTRVQPCLYQLRVTSAKGRRNNTSGGDCSAIVCRRVCDLSPSEF